MSVRKNGQKGVALISSLFFLIIVTVLASAAIMLSTVQMKVAFSISRWESGFASTEGAIHYVIPLIQGLHYSPTRIPPHYCKVLTEPCVGLDTSHPLYLELSGGGADIESNDPQDLHIAASDSLNFDGLDMSIDIDQVGVSFQAGGGIEASWAYHGSSYGSSLMKGYKVTATAATATGSSRSVQNQVIWLRANM